MSAKPETKTIPVLRLSRAEFALIPKAQSSDDVQLHVENKTKRIRTLGDCGNWFVFYPVSGVLFRVEFQQSASYRRRTAIRPTVLA